MLTIIHNCTIIHKLSAKLHRTFKKNYKMFAPHVSAGYCVTPVRAAPFSRLPSRARTIIRDVKRRSMRLRRSASFQVDTTPGTFVRLCEDEVRQKYVEDILKRKDHGDYEKCASFFKYVILTRYSHNSFHIFYHRN